MKTTPAAQFRRLLPTLQHFALFPRCNRAAICQRDGVEPAAIEAFIRSQAGSPELWDEDALAHAAAALQVKVPAYAPAARPHLAALRAAATRAAGGRLAPNGTAGLAKLLAAGRPGEDLAAWFASAGVTIAAKATVFQVEVTPAIAQAWLRLNRGNRNPSKAKVRRFAVAMAAGKWTLNGESVKFSATGRLLDGQSRLMGILAAKRPVVLEVRGGLPDATQATMDAGETRRGSHTLEMLGEANPQILAPALKLIHRWETGALSGNKFGRSSVLENLDVAPLLARHPALKASVGWVASAGYKVMNLLPASEAAFCHYLFGVAHAARRDAFFAALADGIGLTKTSPAYHLRERLLAERVATAKIPKAARLAIVIKAWNAAYARQSLTLLSFKAEGEKVEAFPEIAGAPKKGGAAS